MQALTLRMARDLNAIADSIRKLYEKNKKVKKANLKTCSNCNEEAELISHCSSCNKSICELCLVNDIGGAKIYCESCWDKL